jgi:hypothetical protein
MNPTQMTVKVEVDKREEFNVLYPPSAKQRFLVNVYNSACEIPILCYALLQLVSSLMY